MRRGAVLSPGSALRLAVLAALGCLLLAAGAASGSHTGHGVQCSPAYACHTNARPNEALSSDTWVDEINPTRNYDTGDSSDFLVVRTGPSQKAWTLLRFPIDSIPRNATVLEASFTLNMQEAPTTQRVIRLFELRTPYNEATVVWNDAVTFNTGEAIDNVTAPPGGFNPFEGTRVEFGGGGSAGGLAASLRKYYRGEEPYHGYVLKDTDGVTGGLPMTHRFRSSSNLTPEARRPILTVDFDPNTPDLTGLAADGKPIINATSTRPVNLSAEVFDKLGRVTNAWINVTTLEGREVLNRSVFQNRTTRFINVDRHVVWSNESLGLPEGKYILNFLAADDDGNLNYTDFKLANITVENKAPWVNQSKDPNGALLPFISATELNEGDTFQANVNASDASGIARVHLEVNRSGEVVARVAFQPRAVDANASGDWRFQGPATFGGFVNVTIVVEDRAGNLNRSATFAMHVRDIFPPVIEEALVITPARTAEGAIQEEGGKVAWTARVRDASPLNVSLELSTPNGPEVVPMLRTGLDTFRYERAFDARGSYGATVVARDLDLNTVRRSGLGFFLLEAQAPVISDLRPPPGQAGAGKPTLSAIIGDLNLDPGSLTLEVRVPPAPFFPAEARTVTVTETSRRIEFEDQFFHGETVEVRVRGRDTLGKEAERTWSFTVDGRSPATFLSTEGPSLAGSNRTFITGNTTLRLDRSDEGSGMLATVVAVVNEDTSVGTGNLTITGSSPAFLNLSASPVFRGTGNYTLYYSSVDIAGNLEPTQQRRFLLDDSPPRLEVSFEPGLLTARVQERGSGIREIRAQYWLAPGGQQGVALMSPTADKSVWQAQIPDVERGAQVLYAVEATDLLGNRARAGTEANPLRSIVQNHRPTVTLTPANGSLVRGSVDIEWAASDKDGDALETSVAVRPSTSDTAIVLAPRRGASGQVTWDTTLRGDGLWVVEVTTRDNFEVVVARSLVDVSNTDSKVVAFRVSAGEPGQPVRFEATLYKPVDRAEAVVRRGDAELARIVLQDDGAAPDRVARDGMFTGEWVPDAPGGYRVDLDVLFEDGRLEAKDNAATANVSWGFPAVLWREPVLLVLIVLVVVCGAGFVLYRRYGLPRALERRLRR